MSGLNKLGFRLCMVVFIIFGLTLLSRSVVTVTGAAMRQANQPADRAVIPVYLPIVRRATSTVCGEIPSDTTWTTTGSPYRITCDVGVPKNFTLTIEAGVIVQFTNVENDVIITGTLQAVGTAYAPIRFQPLTGATPGSWGSLEFQPGSSGVLDHTIVEYGGADNSMVFIASRYVQVLHSVVQYSNGGGIAILASSPVISGTQILNNIHSGSFGGGIYIASGSPTIQNNVFTNNSAYYGGGLYNNSGNPKVGNNVFTNNFSAFGAGLYNTSGNPTVQNNIFIQNKSEASLGGSGGGIYSASGNPIIQNNIFTENTANNYGYGGGIWIGGDPIIQDNTFYKNSASVEGGGLYISLGSPVIRSNIIASSSGGGGIYNYTYTSVLDYNDVWNNTGGDYHGTNPGAHDISADPMLVDPANGNLHLAPGSPCIDAGDPVNYPPTDIEGDLRPQGLAPDIGADEYRSP